jgi:hypothetical protein
MPETNMPLLPFRASSSVEGDVKINSQGVSYAADLAVVAPVGADLRFYFPLAKAAPSPGDTVYWVGYDWRVRKDMYRERVFSGKVLRVVAGNIVIDTETTKGSSGSCVLDVSGRVVGIIAWGFSGDEAGEITVAVGTYGLWSEDGAPPPAKK